MWASGWGVPSYYYAGGDEIDCEDKTWQSRAGLPVIVDVLVLRLGIEGLVLVRVVSGLPRLRQNERDPAVVFGEKGQAILPQPRLQLRKWRRPLGDHADG